MRRVSLRSLANTNGERITSRERRRPSRKAIMKHSIFLLLGSLAIGCAQHERTSTDPEVKNAPHSSAVPADNTDKNERDRSAKALTSGDQGGSEADRTVTQMVRQGVMDDDALSTNGKNVKIITIDGVVTLRGPVKSTAEKAAIATIAGRVNGVKRVDNQLETVTN
jgi:hyperosmotically inducible periplasmic protein